MRIAAKFVALSSIVFAGPVFAQLLLKPEPKAPNAYMNEPPWQVTAAFGSSDFGKIESIVGVLAAAKSRNTDGRFQLTVVQRSLREFLEVYGEPFDDRFAQTFALWRKAFPNSAFEPVIEALHANVMAWRARGNRYASSVASEGWKLFGERNARAWKILMDNRKQSSVLPVWYDAAIYTGIDAGQSDTELRAIFDEGVQRFPGFYSIYFAFVKHLSPQWGGSYQSAARFIAEQVAAKTNPEGDILYTRLYLSLDEYDNSPNDFFQKSRVKWPKMRKGFEEMMAQFPDSSKNLATFAIFACRAYDAATYGKLREKVDADMARAAGNDRYTLEICDERFNKQ